MSLFHYVETKGFQIKNPMFRVATSVNNTYTDVQDIGFFGQYYNGSNVCYTGLFRDASDSGKYKIFNGLQALPSVADGSATVNTAGTGYTLASLDVNDFHAFGNTIIEGSLTINGSLNGTANELKISDSYVDNAYPYFKNVNSALSWISANATPSSSSPWVLQLEPGTITETTAINLPAYVSMKGNGRSSKLILNTALHITAFLTILNDTSTTEDFAIYSQGNADYTVEVGAGIFMRGMVLYGGSIASLHILSNSGIMIFGDGYIYRDLVSQPYGLYAESTIGLVSAGIINLLFDNQGTGAYFKNVNGIFKASACPIGYFGWNKSLLLENSYFIINGLSVTICTTAADVTLNSTLVLNSVEAEGFFNIDGTSNLFTNACFLDPKKINVSSGGQYSVNYLETSKDSIVGSHQIGNFIQGSKALSSITYLGQGGSDYNNVVFFTYNGSTFTDVTNNLKLSNPQNTTLFANTSSIFYIGDTVKFSTLSYTVTQAFSGTVSVEYWSGSTWTSVDYMTTSANSPYGSYANSTFNVIGELETRFSIKLYSTAFNWQMSTVNGISRYWIRFRCTALTTSAILNKGFLLYNATKVDNDGISLFYGRSRLYKQILYDVNLIRPTGTTAGATQDIYFGQTSRVGRENNKLATGEAGGFAFFVPESSDASCPFRAQLAYCSDSTAAAQSNFTLRITVGSCRIGDRVYFTSGAASGNNIRNQLQITSASFPVNQTNGQNIVIQELELPMPFLKSRDENGALTELFVADFEKLAGANSNAIVLIQITILYASFANGL